MQDLVRNRALFDGLKFIEAIVEVVLLGLCIAASIYGLAQLSAGSASI